MKFYLQKVQDVLNEKKVTKDGLAASEAARRLEEKGKNKLAEGKSKSMLRRIWEQIKDPMVLMLVVAGIVSGFLGEVADAVIIMIVVALNAVLGIFQESKAEKAIEALQEMSAPHSRVRRDGSVSVIASEDIVPGDIVLLEAGDSVPADIRLIETASLKIEEAALTGESVPVEKSITEIAGGGGGGEVPLGDRVNMAYMGTNVAYGRGEGVVIGTGMDTEMGKIADILSNTEEEKTPLQQKLAGLSKILSISVIGICVFIFIFGVLRSGGFAGNEVLESLLIAVSLAVAAIPEGLVVVVTILLSIGVTKMSAKNSIIRRLTAVETLGCTQVICSDKTGTLTQNKMTVVESIGDEKLLAAAMCLCTDVQADDKGRYVGDPTEIALVEYADKQGLKDIKKRSPRVAEAPFDSLRKMMSTVHGTDTKFRQYTKGAPDEVLKRCDRIYIDGEIKPLTAVLRDKVLLDNKSMADRALRVLAAACKEYDEIPGDVTPENLEKELVFIGLCGMIDPIRSEVKAAIEECRTAGIKAVMITGDHRDTAVAIAKDLGILGDESQAITGAELSEISDAEFEKRIGSISVYARVQPEHKVRIVTMWKKKGRITAMTGDGVNDAPALKSADIGVGMGITGTDVTKNVSDMVLSDDNFASIVYAVEEGRRIYENIRKAIQFLLSSNLAEVVSIFIATILGLKIFSPIQILWINLVTDTFPAMALGMEEAESDSMKKQPRDSKESVFAQGLGIDTVWQGVVIGLLTLWSFFIGNAQTHTTGMTMAFLTLSMCEIFHSLNMRSRDKSIFRLKTRNRFLLGAMIMSFILTMAVMYIPGLNTVFDMTALPVYDLIIALGIAFLIIPINEVSKAIKRSGSK